MGLFKNINQHLPFQQINKHLDKFLGDSSDSLIKVELNVGKEDLENIKLLKDNKEKFEQVLKKYRGKPLNDFNFLSNWNLADIHENQALIYTITNNNLNYGVNRPESIYLQYLNYFELFIILSKGIENIKIQPRYLYFSPYRGESQQNLQANLSAQNYYQLLGTYSGTTSKTVSSLIGLATYYFAEKRRNYEDSAKDQGYEDKWNNDAEVKLVTKYLKRILYSWDLRLIDKNKNIYEIVLTKDGREFLIGQASSGEKEILNFLLGIFAFNIRNGLIIIDEPEIHLHPKWQSVLMDLFIELAIDTGNQFIISTHSPIFINDKTISNVIRVYKNQNNSSKIITINKNNLSNVMDLLHIINSHNNEKMFFADKVVLVEGIQDRLLFEKLISSSSNDTNKSEIVEVLEVHGKDNLLKYREFLENIKVINFIVADNDYIYTVGDNSIKKLFTTDFQKIDEKVIKDKKSKDGKALAESLEISIEKNDIEGIKPLWEYIKNRKRKLRDNLSDEERKILNEFLKEKSKEKIYILQKGEIEDYLPEKFKRLESTIELIKDENFNKWISETKGDEKGKELEGIVSAIRVLSP